MAQAREVKVGQVWTAKVSGKPVQVEVLDARQGDNGRRQFRIRNLSSNRVSKKWWGAGKLKKLVRDAGAPPAPAPPPAPPPAKRRPKQSRRPRPAPPRRSPPVEPEVLPASYQETEPVYPAELTSLRGRGRPPAPAPQRRAPARPRAAQTPEEQRAELFKQLKKQLKDMVKEAQNEYELTRRWTELMSNYHSQIYGFGYMPRY